MASYDGLGGHVTESSGGGASYDALGAHVTETPAAAPAAGVARLTAGALIHGGSLKGGKLVES